jgi:hypothetical protein
MMRLIFSPRPSGHLAYRHRLGTMRTAPRVDWDLAQAFRTLFGCGISWSRSFPHSSYERIDWGHDEEINSCGNQKKRNRSIDKVTDRKNTAVNAEVDRGEVRFADQRGDERSKKILGEGGNHASESSADDYTDGKINNITAKNKLLESAEHG